jgi:hypothetical protein
VRISVMPHCTQLWVMSSRSLDAAPLDNAGWGTDNAFRLRELITERGASGCFARGR